MSILSNNPDGKLSIFLIQQGVWEIAVYFEYVLAHNRMTFEDNQRMRGFLFWARVLAENLVLRHTWIGLRGLAGLTQSQVLQNFDAWISAVDDPAAAALREFAAMPFGGSGLGSAITFMYTDPDAQRLLNRWWTESIRPLLSPDVLPALIAAIRSDASPDLVPTPRTADLHYRTGFEAA